MLQEFLDKSRRTLNTIHELNNIVKEIEECIRMKQTSVLSEDKEKILDNKMDELDEKFDTLCHEIKETIATTQEETERLQKQGELVKEEVEMREVHVYKYYKGLSDAVMSYRNLKSDFKNKEKDLLKQAYQIVHPKATDEELDRIIESSDGESSLASAFGSGTVSGQQMVDHAMDRAKRIATISQTIAKLVATIKELSTIVNKNTKVIDDIVINVTKAEMNTRAANKELEAAIEYQKKINMIKRIIALIFIVLIIFAFVMIATSGPVSSLFSSLGSNDDGK